MDFALTVYIVTVILNKNAALYGIAEFHLLKMELLYWHQTELWVFSSYLFQIIMVWDLTCGIVIIILLWCRNMLLRSLQQDSLFLLYHCTLYHYTITFIFQHWHWQAMTETALNMSVLFCNAITCADLRNSVSCLASSCKRNVILAMQSKLIACPDLP